MPRHPHYKKDSALDEPGDKIKMVLHQKMGPMSFLDTALFGDHTYEAVAHNTGSLRVHNKDSVKSGENILPFAILGLVVVGGVYWYYR
jgi:hypothetical protein